MDETFITLDEEGTPGSRHGNLGPPVNPIETTKVIEFNDVPALETALSAKDVAVVLAEPVMTNIGIIHPDPGYHDSLREITRRNGTLLIIDETHTLCASPGGYTGKHGLQPDFLTCGKPLGGWNPGGRLWVHTGGGGRILGQTRTRPIRRGWHRRDAGGKCPVHCCHARHT